MPSFDSPSEERLEAPPLIGSRLGLAALRRVLEAHRNWLDSRPDGQRASLEGIVLAEAALDQVNLERADLKAANFIDARMTGANLSGAVLEWAELGNATLIEADLSRADLTDAKLDLALLAVANLSETRLLRTSFRKANLRAARLQEADMEQCDFREAVLQDACLHPHFSCDLVCHAFQAIYLPTSTNHFITCRTPHIPCTFTLGNRPPSIFESSLYI